jgi:pectate lyase
LTLDVPVDIENTERDDPTGIGAYNGEVLGPVLLYQDSFDRADGDIDGSTLSGGTGTWDVITPDVTIATNRATTTLPSGSALAVVGDMTPVGDQRVSAKITNGIVEIVARYSVGGFYTVYPSSGAIHLYSSGTGGIGDSAAATFADGDTIDLECIGTTIKGYVNGVEVVSATNADHASGIAGVSPTNAAYANDFKVYA